MINLVPLRVWILEIISSSLPLAIKHLWGELLVCPEKNILVR